MRAKRYIYIVIGIALCLQACRRDSHPSNPDVEELAISMAASSVESTTRALINSAAHLQSFRVDAYKKRDTSVEKIFDLQEITKAGAENPAWTYSPTRYWDVKCTYYFGAYSPIDAAVSKSTAGALTISAPNWQAIDGTEKDIIVATSKGAATDYLNDYNGTVKFDFEHILAQLEVKIVRSATLLNTYTLTGLSYKQVPEGDGKSDDNNKSDYTLNYATTPSSSVMNSTATGTKAVYSGAVVVDPKAKEETTFKHLVVPFSTQEEGGMLVAVTYKVGSGEPTTIAVKTNISTLEAGKRYVLTLTFNSGANIIPDLSVCGWAKEEVEEDDKYNW